MKQPIKYNIREMVISDIDNVINMMCDVFDKENIFLEWRHDKIKEELDLGFISKIEKYNVKYYIVENENEIIGVNGIKESFISDNVYELCWTTVKHEYQKMGIGTKLIEKSIEWAKLLSKNNNIRILVCTRVPDMFKKLGFIEFMKPNNNYYLYLMCEE
jgi:N-acetylglutamate synthase-like GNAT family acetyltransferase